jgi:hypothetical protein
VVGEIPVDLGRDAAQEAAERELSDPAYADAAPPLMERVLRWIAHALDDLLDAAAAVSPGGYAGLIVLAVLAVLAVIAIRLRIGRIGRAAARSSTIFDDRVLTAADHRAAADAHAVRGAWTEAVRERLRAIVRGLEERDLLDVRASRTADEAAAEAGRALPERAADLREAARIFDDVWYGGRAATAAMDARLRAVDDAVAATRPVIVR